MRWSGGGSLVQLDFDVVACNLGEFRQPQELFRTPVFLQQPYYLRGGSIDGVRQHAKRELRAGYLVLQCALELIDRRPSVGDRAIFPATEVPTADDFYLESHREIFRAMLALAEVELQRLMPASAGQRR